MNDTITYSLARQARAAHPARERNDYYPTPAWVTRALLSVERFQSSVIWEPACGDGRMSRVLLDHGYSVYSSDLVDRGYGATGRDFLTCSDLVRGRAIVTNPPFSLAGQFVHHALDLGADEIAMLLRLTFLEGQARRRELFDVRPPARVWVLSRRPGFDALRDGGGSGVTAYAWYVWRRGHLGPPHLGWV